MRKARIKESGESWYHVVSRTAFQLFKFDDDDKDAFVAIMRKCAIFSGINVLNFCVMSNHFHILVKVPKPVEITEEIVLKNGERVRKQVAVRDVLKALELLAKIRGMFVMKVEGDFCGVPIVISGGDKLED